MSAQPTSPAVPPDHVSIEIDGRAMQVPKGTMIIEAADKVGIPIPRFCYHDKLPIAANCRMCLVDVEKAPKPMPACATPVMDGMKVYTQSKRALDSQRNVMEFLLINHPLDCPICDQGGECELQDLAVGYGRSVSRFVERKRVVADEDLGPLVATDMTRCIHCTRCVRFVAEIGGTNELGGMNRGEHLEIGTYIGKNLESELSGNVIDVCPVGALTNKPFRFKARPWELVARDGIGWHDALGSNLHLHTRRGEVLRVVPRENEAINECWLSDRDRYSHEGLQSEDRVTQPLVRRGGALVPVSWDEAVQFVAEGLAAHRGEVGSLVAPFSSCEEGALAAAIVRALGSESIDHRLRVADFTDGPVAATFELPLAAIEQAQAILIVGGNPRLDAPLLGHRIRKAWKRGAKVCAINPIDFDFHFELAAKTIVEPRGMLDAIERAADGEIGAALRDAASSVVLFGDFAVQHPQAGQLRAAARRLAQALGAAFDEMPAGPNSIGLSRVGALPGAGGADVAAMLAAPPAALLLLNAVAGDFADAPAFDAARRRAEFVVALSAYACATTRESAHAILPVTLPPESDGTWINVDGRAQTVAAGARPPGETRQAWRVLRALGAKLAAPGFEFTELAELRARLAAQLVAPGASRPAGETRPTGVATGGEGLARVATVAPYRVDAVVRRAAALQATPIASPPRVVLNPADALARGLAQGTAVRVSGGAGHAVLPLEVSLRVPTGAAWIEAGHAETAGLPGTGAVLTIERS